MAVVLTKCGASVLIDDDDLSAVQHFRWRLSKDGYAFAGSGSKSFSMHRMLLDAKKGEIVDHKNRNRLDNRRINLRLVDARLNALNRGSHRNAQSRFKGVNRHPHGWQVYVRSKYIGIFKDELSAAEAYDAAAVAEYGDQAVTNRLLGYL